MLVVAAEYELRELLLTYLRREGIEVIGTASGARAIVLAGEMSPDLVLLDLSLSDVPGETVLRELRRCDEVPVLVINGKATEEERIRGFELGADDYVVRPFNPRELLLRVLAILRRSRSTKNGPEASSYGKGELVIDEARMEVRVRGAAVILTPTQWSLLTALARYPGRVYSRPELAGRARGYDYEGDHRTIDSHIRNLRQRIEDDRHRPRIILTVLGGGYRFGLHRDDHLSVPSMRPDLTER